MTIADAVRGAKNPQEAMLALAEGMDLILAKLDEFDTAPSPGAWEMVWDQADAEETVPEGTRPEIEEHENELVVHLPSVTPEKFVKRLAFARDVLQLTDNLGPDEEVTWNEAYARGGPLWLYYGNRDFVLGLPVEVKQQMIQDVLEQSPAEAQEMGRDILKDAHHGGLPDFTPNV